MPNSFQVDDVAVVRNNQIVFESTKFSMASDSTVAGSGKFVRTDAAEKMISDYIITNENIYRALIAARDYIENQTINTEESQSLQKQALISQLAQSITILSEENDVVSGTYGKELILNLLSREGCEGLRYTCCRYKNKNSIVFTSIDKDGENKNDISYLTGKTTIDFTDPKGEIKARATTRGKLKIKGKEKSNLIENEPDGSKNWGKLLLAIKDE
jgi:hypothetical protein